MRLLRPARSVVRDSFWGLVLVAPALCCSQAQADGARVRFAIETPLYKANTTSGAQKGQEIEFFRQTQVGLILSPKVMEGVASGPGIADLATKSDARPNPAKWIRGFTKVDFEPGSKALTVTVADPSLTSDEARMLVEAICEEYEQLLVASKEKRLFPRTILAQAEEKLSSEIRRKMESLQAVSKEAGALSPLGSGLVGDQIGRLESEVLRLEAERFHEGLAALKQGARTSEAPESAIQREVERIYDDRIAELRKRIDAATKQLTGGAKYSAEIETRRGEIEQLRAVQKDVAHRIEGWDIEAEAPDAVQRIPGVELF